MKTAHIDRSDTKLDRIVLNRFSCSYMSNAKWVKLIKALVHMHPLVRQCQVKLIWDEEIRELCLDEHTTYLFDYYDTVMEAMISGYPKGWYAYKEIEWLSFPLDVELPVNKNNLCAGTKRVPQDVEAIARGIRELGQFALEQSEKSLMLYAYKRKKDKQPAAPAYHQQTGTC